MLVETPVLGREHRLDQMVGKFLQRDRVVVLDAAAADLVAIAVEEGDGEFRLLEPLVVRGLAERRDGERQHEHEAAGAKRRPSENISTRPPAPAGDVEAVHEGGEALVELARPGLGLVQPKSMRESKSRKNRRNHAFQLPGSHRRGRGRANYPRWPSLGGGGAERSSR